MLDPLLNIAIFIIWWWIALLALLPVGVRRVEQGDIDLGHDAGHRQIWARRRANDTVGLMVDNQPRDVIVRASPPQP